jgi:hypothetical protein
VNPQLRPRQHLQEFLRRAQTAGQRHEGVARVGHTRLALMDVRDHLEVREPGVRDLVRQHAARHHTRHRAAGGKGRVGHGAHQPDAGTAVDHAQARFGEGAAEFGGGPHMTGPVAGGGPAEDGHRRHAHSPYPLVRT